MPSTTVSDSTVPTAAELLPTASASATQPGTILPPILYLIFGSLLISLPLAALIFSPELSQADPTYLRAIAACGGALIGALIPGVLNVNLPAVKAGGAIGLFAIIFFLNPPQRVIDRQHAVRQEWTYDTWRSFQLSGIPSIEKPARFPTLFTYTDSRRLQGSFTYDAEKKVFIERTVLPNVPYYFFRPVRYQKNTLWIFDDSRNFTVKLPESGGVAELSSDGLDGHFGKLQEVRPGNATH